MKRFGPTEGVSVRSIERKRAKSGRRFEELSFL